MRRRDFLQGAAASAVLASPALAITPSERLLILSKSRYVPPLDGIQNIYAAGGTAQLLTSYTGPLVNLRRNSDNATRDFSAVNGYLSQADIGSWAAGATAFLAKMYDQSGNARDFSPASSVVQPSINLLGAHPVLQFDGTTQEIDCTTQLAAFSQNQGGGSIVSVRRHSVTSATDRTVAYASTTSAITTRMAMGPSSATGTSVVSARRLDADALARSAGFVNDTNWGTEIGRWDWTNNLLKHQLDSQSESRSISTAGNTSNTASARAMIGSTGAAGFFVGNMSMIAFIQRSLTDQEVASLI